MERLSEIAVFVAGGIVLFIVLAIFRGGAPALAEGDILGALGAVLFGGCTGRAGGIGCLFGI